MEDLEKEDRKELDCLTAVVNFGFQKGWITENERMQIEIKRTLDKKKNSLFELLKNMKRDKNASRLLCVIRCINEFKPSTDSENFEYRFLSAVMSKLFVNGLVTPEEKLAFEEEVNDRNAHPNPLQQHPIIKCVLKYLDFQDIKKSRHISKDWSSVALNVLATRSKITFSPTANADRGPVKFFQVFPDAVEEIIPFTAFTITGDEKNPWRVDELDYFFRTQGKCIRELKLGKLYLVDKCWQKIDHLDITPWISNSPMTKSNTKYKTKLSVSEVNDLKQYVHREKPTQLSVNLSALVSVKTLELDDYQINLQDGIRISPVRLKSLSNVSFFKDGNKLTELCVNDIIDFSKAKALRFGCDRDQDENNATKLSLVLDENEELKINYLCAQRIAIKNWKTCKWTVNELVLHKVPFNKKTEMQVKKLSLIDSDIDLSVLPQQPLESLEIEQTEDETCVCSQPIVLLNVKTLHLNFDADCFSAFYQHVKCPNLVSLALLLTSDFVMSLAWIPKTVKTLQLSQVELTSEENESLNLDKLVLNDYNPAYLKEICTTPFQAKELVVSSGSDNRDEDLGFLDFLEYQKGFADVGQRIYLGPCDWETQAGGRPLRANVDQEAKYYIFENMMGKTIEPYEFYKISNIDV